MKPLSLPPSHTTQEAEKGREGAGSRWELPPTAPTMPHTILPNAPFRGFSKRGWVYSVHDPDLRFINLDPPDQRTENLAARLPVRRLQALLNLVGKTL